NLELTIGVSNLKGALIAQGTVDDPILFTSNAETPAPGDWQGICLEAATDDALTILEHCAIEYGGYSNRSNIMVNNASPTIKNNTLRYSSYYGIRVIGEDSAPVIGGEAGAGNFITDNNTYGVYFAGANTLATVTHNEITDNGSFPIRVLPLMCNVTNNICTGNSQDGIEVIGGN
ncbi:MAG: right-handed parallel beta-helix repeat-containing protein, partial [Planctomycetes bacterium]|nr:right-handed parallel beta-helix repeat-containing protein [Planctomycetota bacterium]